MITVVGKIMMSRRHPNLVNFISSTRSPIDVLSFMLVCCQLQEKKKNYFKTLRALKRRHRHSWLIRHTARLDQSLGWILGEASRGQLCRWRRSQLGSNPGGSWWQSLSSQMRFDNLLLSEKNNAQCTEVVIGSKSLHKFILYIGQLLLAQTQRLDVGLHAYWPAQL